MKYIRPHLSPEIRAQITPETRRDRRFATAGVVFLILSAILTFNLFARKPSSTNNKIQLSQAQPEASPEKQVLGAATVETQESEKQEFTSYVVKNGDTLFNISQQYGIKWDLIAELNSLSEPYLLHPGQTLKIPQATTSKLEGKIYTIKKGDTLASIARSFNITVDDIIAVNPNLQTSDLITVGQVIKLP
ncbi:MAG: LysM peptidoglycan-binding domain-containing protein [Candidatus Doudnabacteria bacterium]|nr:LysM peptidoglycan-binding domain-containing protein [Candidatus Doudnabacteria bacterium]